MSPSDPPVTSSPAAAATQSTELMPHECRITVVTFVPFLGPHAVSGLAPVHGDHAALLAELELWGCYTDKVTAELREHLPHRRARAIPDGPRSRVDLGLGEWVSEHALLDVWSVGVGMATFVDRLRIDDGVSWAELHRVLAGCAAKELALARTTGLGAGRVDGPPRPSEHGEPGAPLWAQQMIVVEARREVGEQELDAVADVLTAGGPRLPIPVGTADAVLRLGYEACVVSNPGVVAVCDALARVVATQTAIWAATIDLDRLLKATLDAEDAQGLPLKKLEQRSRDLLRDYQRVQRFRAEIDVIDIHLATWDKMVWQAVCTQWPLDDQVASLTAKLDAVGHVYRNLADVLITRQARFLNNVVLAVTSLSLATFFLTVVEFVRKRFDPLDWVSVVIAVAAVAISILAFVVAWVSGRQRVSGRLGLRRGPP